MENNFDTYFDYLDYDPQIYFNYFHFIKQSYQLFLIFIYLRFTLLFIFAILLSIFYSSSFLLQYRPISITFVLLLSHLSLFTHYFMFILYTNQLFIILIKLICH
jgi:hypothetical protein